MDIQTIKQNFDLVSLAQKQVKLKRTGAYHIGPCPFCGGEDRFTIKQTAKGDRWHCRGCGGDQYHSVIDFIMRRDGLSYLEAVQSLGGDTIPSSYTGHHPESFTGHHPDSFTGYHPECPLRENTPELTIRSKSDKISFPSSRPRWRSRSTGLPSESWQEKGRDFVLKASEALLGDPKASIARAYLKARKLERGTWLRVLLWGMRWSMIPSWGSNARRSASPIWIGSWISAGSNTASATPNPEACATAPIKAAAPCCLGWRDCCLIPTPAYWLLRGNSTS